MKKNLSHPFGRRMLSLVMVLLMAFPWVSTPALAASQWSGLEIRVSWTDGGGNPQSAMASPLGWTEDSAFWVQVSSNEPFQSLTLSLSAPGHEDYTYSTSDSHGNDLVVTNVKNAAGANKNDAIYITGYDGSGSPLSPSIILYVSTSIAPTPTPEPTDEPTPRPPATATIDVYYRGTDGAELLNDTFDAVEGEQEVITPVQTSFEANGTYTLKGPQEYRITFNENGEPNTRSVTFEYEPPKEPAKADIDVFYRGTDGAEFPKDTFLAVEGQPNRITPKEFEGYTLKGPAEYFITFNENGEPDTWSVTFEYDPVQKEPAKADIDVFYRGTDGAEFPKDTFLAVEGQPNRITPKEFEGYTLKGPAEYFITFNENGEPDTWSVTFEYDPVQKEPAKADIDVFYRGSDGAEFPKDTFLAVEGQPNRITPKEFEGYTLKSKAEYFITFNENGEPDTWSVTFEYDPVQKEPAKTTVQVFYRGPGDLDMGSTTFDAVEGQENRIDAPTTPEGHAGYTLTGDSVQYVTVNENGEANPSPVIFRYTPNMIPVPIVYLKDGQPLGEGSQKIPAGSNNVPVNADLNMTPAGYQLEGSSFVNVSVDTQGVATPNKVTFNFISTPAQSVQVRIEYTKDGAVFKTDSKPIAIPGTGTVDANPNPVPEGYRLEGAASVNVTVDAKGKAIPEKVIFNYVPIPVATIRIEYLKDGQPLGEGSVKIPAGSQSVPVNADLNMTPAGYRLESASSVNVTVDDQGKAKPEKVTFNFIPNPVGPAKVSIEYIKDGNIFNTSSVDIPAGSQNVPVNADTNMTPAGYTLEGPATVNVSVDVSGVATPSKVTFNYVSVKKTITVYYRNESNGDIATTQKKALGVGTHQIKPEPADLQANYRIKGDTVKTVTVNQDGTSNVDSVTFVYEYVPPVVETPIPVGNAIDRWGVTNDGVNFRSSPSTGNNKNLIKSLSSGAHVWMYESLYNEANEVWTRVNVDGQDGYIMTKFIKMMTQAESDAYQATLQNPKPTRSPAPTPVPSQYVGDALTNKQVALRVAVGNADQDILTTLPMNTLVKVVNQVYQNGTPWSLVETLDEITGYVPDDSLRRITPEEAKYYIDQYNAAHPTASPTPTPTPSPAPAQHSGYAATLGDNVPMRGAADPNSMLVNMLTKNVVVYVSGQEYLDGVAWNIVQYAGQWGYIRADQLRWLSREETEAYLNSLNTPTPTPAATLPPLNQDSPSSYGYVTVSSGSVNFRSTPGGTKIGTLNNYAFALVLSSTQVDGKTWYKVNQAGREGYISGDYFHVLTLAELEDFLQSPEYNQGGTGNTGNNNNNNSGNNSNNSPTSPEDWNVGTWTNPNTGLNATYEPFDPYATPDPLPTPSPSPTPEPLATFEPLPTEPPVETQSDSPSFIWLGLGVTLLGGFGGLYAYALHKSNKRKAAARAAQRRAAMPQNPQSGARPYARATNAPMPPASGTQARPATPPTGAQRPQTPGSTSPYSQRPAPTQPTGAAQRPAGTRPAQPGAAPAARPGQQPSAFARPTGTQPGAQPPASFRPEAQGSSAAPEGQGGTTQHGSALNNTTRQSRTARHAGNPPAGQTPPTDTNENL